MGMRAHVQTKHVIEYGGSYFNWMQEAVYHWLCENDVQVYTPNEQGAYAEDWEIEKEGLEAIPESAYRPLCEGTDDEISADELREFVKDLLAAPTGDPDYAWVSWF